MTPIPDTTERERLALRVVELARADILSSAGFLAPAVGRLRLRLLREGRAPAAGRGAASGASGFPPQADGGPCAADAGGMLATDGTAIAVDAGRVLSAFAETGKPPTHDVLHVVLHCVLLHPFVPPAGDRAIWWLACDIVAECLAARLLGLRDGARGVRIGQVLHAVETGCGDAADATCVYRVLAREDASTREEWTRLFASDDHECWTRGLAMGEDFEDGREAGDPAGDGEAAREGAASGASVGREVGELPDPAESWKRIARNLKAALEALPRDFGARAGVLAQALEASLRERVDYASWLRRFAVPGEVMRLSDAGFDLVFYTYGLRRYGNLPLVEPLEQREERRIREFVIVIDTSQSVSGEAVRRFVDETCGILKEGESFFERVHVRIIQCDARVQSDTVITDLRELEEWSRHVELRGFGGTDFRPAFRYVDRLVEEGAFENLGGLVYFTDGWGAYPEWRPRYPVAFAFYDEDHRAEEVPPWAVQVVLDDGALGVDRASQTRDVR